MMAGKMILCNVFFSLLKMLKSYLKSDGFFFVAIYRGIERLKPLIHNKNIISFAINLPKLVDSVPYFYLLFYSPNNDKPSDESGSSFFKKKLFEK